MGGWKEQISEKLKLKIEIIQDFSLKSIQKCLECHTECKIRFPMPLDNGRGYCGLIRKNVAWALCTFLKLLKVFTIWKAWYLEVTIKTISPELGMAYRITDISEKPIYRLFCKYRISVSVKIISVKISDIGKSKISDIGYRQMIKYPRLIVQVES